MTTDRLRSARLSLFLLATLTLTSVAAQAQADWGRLDYTRALPVTGSTLGSIVRITSPVLAPAGELASFEARAMPVEVDWNVIAALDPDRTHRVDVPIPDGDVLEIALLWSEVRTDASFTWYGEIAGVAMSDVILVRYEDVVQMEIRDYETPRRFQIRSLGGKGHSVREIVIDPAAQAPTWCSQPPEVDRSSSPETSEALPRRMVNDPAYQVDIMTCLTAQALAAYGSANAFVAESQVAVDDFNLRQFNSRRSNVVTLRLVAADAQVTSDYSEAPGEDGFRTDRERLRITNDGFMDAVHAARDLYRADLVALIRRTPSSGVDGGFGILGIAYTGYRQPPENDYVLSADIGFSVNAMRGSLPLVGDIFAHEVGHNFSLQHDLTTWNEQSDFPMQPERHGKRIECTAGCFLFDNHYHTTMAYGLASGCGPSTLLPVFSSPEATVDPSGSCGPYNPGDAGIAFAAWILESYGSPLVSQYRIGLEQQWTAPGATGVGTFISPRGGIRDALVRVEGGADVGTVRARAGTYLETFRNGGTVVLDTPGRIVAQDGVVVID